MWSCRVCAHRQQQFWIPDRLTAYRSGFHTVKSCVFCLTTIVDMAKPWADTPLASVQTTSPRTNLFSSHNMRSKRRRGQHSTTRMRRSLSRRGKTCSGLITPPSPARCPELSLKGGYVDLMAVIYDLAHEDHSMAMPGHEREANQKSRLLRMIIAA